MARRLIVSGTTPPYPTAEIMLDRDPYRNGGFIGMITRTFDIFADPWTYLVLREIFFRVRRFDEIRHNIEISRKTLTERLSELVAAGLLERQPYQTNPIRHEYRLTEAGIDFYPAIIALMLWGDRWRSGAEKPLELFDRHSGARLDPVIACQHCRMAIKATEIEIAPKNGPRPSSRPFTGVLRRAGGGASYTRGRPCSVAAALTVMGDRWSARIVWGIFLGAQRFDDFVAGLGIARNILSSRLDKLQSDGVVEAIAYQTRPPRYDYRLTPAGSDLTPSLLMMMTWANRWGAMGEEDALADLLHTPCGKLAAPVLLDRSSGIEISARTTHYKTSY
jgi:DNA-binding HxlR family transcriptional regulator